MRHILKIRHKSADAHHETFIRMPDIMKISFRKDNGSRASDQNFSFAWHGNVDVILNHNERTECLRFECDDNDFEDAREQWLRYASGEDAKKDRL